MVASERRYDCRLVGEDLPILGCRGEESLEQRDGGVEYDAAFTSGFDADMDFLVVHTNNT